MSEEIKKLTTITLEVGLDDNHIPVDMDWSASDSGETGKCKAFLLSIWDEKDDNTMSIDLWTKEMSVYDMQRFFHQTLLTMGDTYKNATNEDEVAADFRAFAEKFATKTGILG